MLFAMNGTYSHINAVEVPLRHGNQGSLAQVFVNATQMLLRETWMKKYTDS